MIIGSTKDILPQGGRKCHPRILHFSIRAARTAAFLLALCLAAGSAGAVHAAAEEETAWSAADSTASSAETQTTGSTVSSAETQSAAAGDIPLPEIVTAEPAEPPEEDIIEDAEPPIEVDWDEMKALNPDIIGYLHVDGMPVISYPILYSGDDEYYLHRDVNGEELYAGSIFLEALNSPDFADPNCLIYGHNMADGSKFGSLKFMDSQEKYDANPYFWILTPRGNYRYKIFSMFRTPATSDVYLVYSWHGSSFLAWEKMWRESSDVKTDVPLTAQDRTVCLTTCTSDENVRFVVFGKCVSSKKPVHTRTIADGPSLQDSSPSLPE